MDRKLKDKLYAESEAIVLRWLKALERLRENQYMFTKSKAMENELQDYKIKNDNVLSFIYDVYKVIPINEYEKNPNAKAKKYTELYSEYTRYCTHMGYKACNKKIFKESIIRNNELVYKERDKGARNLVMNLVLNTEAEYDLLSDVFEWYAVESKEKTPFDKE